MQFEPFYPAHLHIEISDALTNLLFTSYVKLYFLYVNNNNYYYSTLNFYTNNN